MFCSKSELTDKPALHLVNFLAQVLDLTAILCSFLFEVLADELVILTDFLQALILLLEVVALFDHMFDIALDPALHLLMFLCLTPMFLELCLEKLDFVCHLLSAPLHFLQF